MIPWGWVVMIGLACWMIGAAWGLFLGTYATREEPDTAEEVIALITEVPSQKEGSA